MNKEQVVAALREAEELAAEVSAPYQATAFEIIATQLLERFKESAEQATEVRHSTNGGGSRQDEFLPESVNELLAVLAGQPHTDRFMAVIYHSLKHGSSGALATEEIVNAYQATRMSRPSNPSDVIAKCFRKGYVREDVRREGQRTWRLTGRGERYVEQLIAEASRE